MRCWQLCSELGVELGVGVELGIRRRGPRTLGCAGVCEHALHRAVRQLAAQAHHTLPVLKARFEVFASVLYIAHAVVLNRRGWAGFYDGSGAIAVHRTERVHELLAKHERRRALRLWVVGVVLLQSLVRVVPRFQVGVADYQQLVGHLLG